MESNDSSRAQHRLDIQLLRAFAVLIVVFYHADVPGFAGGYLGVDVFFVVSGCLMTTVIAKGIEDGSFSFRGFFLRRARRLLPASLVTVAFVGVLAPLILGARELQDLKAQIIGAVTFTSNFVLWRQSDYFSGAAELKPLLHIWSLSLEEQYYIILPLLLFCLPPRFWKPACIALIVLSAMACLVAMRTHPSAAFYLLPTRAWELGIGSLCALVAVSPRTASWLRRTFWPAMALLAWISFRPFSGIHPSWDAVIACIATACILLRRHQTLGIGTAWAFPVWIGNISYSLYLVHWPIFAFLSNSFVGYEGEKLPFSYRMSAIIVAVTMAGLMYRFVEIPGKRLFDGRRLLAAMWVLFSSVAVIGAALLASNLEDRGSEWTEINRTNFGLSRKCGLLNDGALPPECITAPNPRVLVWGDSFAMHLVPGLAVLLPDVGVAQASRSNCGPLLGLAKYSPESGNNFAWARDCIEFNSAVVEHVEKSASIQLVVISSPFDYFVGEGIGAELAVRDNGSLSTHAATVELAVRQIDQTVDRLRRAGKEVLLVAPPPQEGRDIGRCLERAARSLPQIVERSCNIDLERYHLRTRKVRRLLSEVAIGSNLRVISFDGLLCSDGVCRTSIDGVGIYRDSGHLSYRGSEELLREAEVQAVVRDAMIRIEEGARR